MIFIKNNEMSIYVLTRTHRMRTLVVRKTMKAENNSGQISEIRQHHNQDGGVG
jgi:hypothetical protein